jgi:hypothetical protein
MAIFFPSRIISSLSDASDVKLGYIPSQSLYPLIPNKQLLQRQWIKLPAALSYAATVRGHLGIAWNELYHYHFD